MISSVQAAGSLLEKRSSVKYNKGGQKQTVIKPDDIQIQHTYDPLGRLDHYFSSDNSFHYHYTYDPNSNPAKVEDLIHNTQTIRSYNSYNQITSEILQNGLIIAQGHTPEGQLTSLTLPDQSSVNYTYQAHHIKSAERLNGKAHYTHTFDTYDLLGQNTQETLLHQIGSIERHLSKSPRIPHLFLEGLWL